MSEVTKIILTAIEDKQKYYEKYRLHQRYPNVPRNFCIIGNMEGLGGKQNCYPANWDLLRERGYVLLARPNRNPDKTYKNRFEEAMKEAVNPHIIYSMWAGYLEEEHADAKDNDEIQNERCKLHNFNLSFLFLVYFLLFQK